MTAEEIIQLIRDKAQKNFGWSLEFPPGSNAGKLYDYSHRALSSMADEIENKLKEEQNMDKLEGDELKKDGGKVPMHLLPISDLEPLARVYEFGAKKYEEGSWRKIEPTQENINRIASALMRHIAEWQEHYQTTGEFATDEEIGLPTMAHVMWNAVELMHLERMSKDGKRIMRATNKNDKR